MKENWEHNWVDEEFTVKCHNCGNVTVKPKGKHWVFCSHCGTALDIMDKHEEIRWYKGKYKVKVVLTSKGNWMVEALEDIPLNSPFFYNKKYYACAPKGVTFVTVPRLLWKHPKGDERK